jgi:hypothetical protein
MTRAGIAALFLALSILPSCRDGQAATNQAALQAEKPQLHLLTSLPLLFGEQFGLDQPRPPITAALEQRYRLTAVDVATQLPPGAILLAVQPRALPAEELVALDRWVRDGGRLMLLADPMLEWHSERPLGDLLRPPIMFGDTGLLAHWGLRLDAPDERGPVRARIEGRDLSFASPGALVKQGGSCTLSAPPIVATCAIGKGRATIVADADWLNQELVADGGGDPAMQAGQLIEWIESLRRDS